jgi:IS1 family transposase
MNKLTDTRRAAVIGALCEGTSVRATCRLTGTAKGTVLRLLAEVGQAAQEYQNKTLVNLPMKRVECDEIWSFVGAKEKNTQPELRGTAERGDAWVWTAIDAESKLAVCWQVGPRDADSAKALMEGVAARVAGRIQITTDGLRFYLNAVEEAFDWNGADFARLVKLFGGDTESSKGGLGKYSPAPVVGTIKEPIFGNPDEALISTSYVERTNLTMRMQMRRFTRLTNAFSKKLENHAHAVSLFFLHYNFCRAHQTLTADKKGVKCPPAMAAGIADHVWKIEEIVALLSN